MKTLVVHDRSDIGLEVQRIVSEIDKSGFVEVVEDGSSARAKLGSTQYDLLIIDLTLPFIKGRDLPDYRTADQLLAELFTLENMMIPGDVIGLTKDAEALSGVRTSLGPHLMVMIEESSDDRWKSYLADKIKYAMRAAFSRHVTANSQNWFDALVITALDEEQEPIARRLGGSPLRYFSGAFEFPFQDGSGVVRRGVRYSIGRSGQASAASYTQSLVSLFRPKVAIMTGFCGGPSSHTSFGDLIFFDTVYDWDYGKWETVKINADVVDEEGNGATTVFKARPNPISFEGADMRRAIRDLLASDFCKRPDLIKACSSLSQGKIDSFTAELKAAASGSAVVGEEAVVGQIQLLNDSIRAVDMESYGFYHACKNTHVVRPSFVCLKAVADHCDGNKSDEFHAVCSEISASAAHELLTRFFTF